MSAVVSSIRRVVEDLSAIGARVALVGGLAVSARAEPRFTRDMDFAVAVANDQEAERVIFALQARGYRVVMVLEQEATGRMATVRLVPPYTTDDEALADLLFASSGLEPEIVERAEPLTIIPGLLVPVASVGHLLAMKLLSHDPARRPRDAEDLLALIAIAGQGELNECRDALALVQARGFARGKQLDRELAQLLARAGR